MFYIKYILWASVVYIGRVSSFYYQLKTSFSYLMQIWQLVIVLRQPVNISVTIFSNSTKLTNYVVSSHFRAETKRNKHRFFSFLLGTTRNEVVSFCFSEKQELPKVVSTFSALRCSNIRGWLYLKTFVVWTNLNSSTNVTVVAFTTFFHRSKASANKIEVIFSSFKVLLNLLCA